MICMNHEWGVRGVALKDCENVYTFSPACEKSAKKYLALYSGEC